MEIKLAKGSQYENVIKDYIKNYFEGSKTKKIDGHLYFYKKNKWNKGKIMDYNLKTGILLYLLEFFLDLIDYVYEIFNVQLYLDVDIKKSLLFNTISEKFHINIKETAEY